MNSMYQTCRFFFLVVVCLTNLALLFPVFGYQVQVGSGTLVTGSSTPSPVNIYYRSQTAQMVYTASELLNAGAAPGLISQLGFYVESVPSFSLPGYTIRLGTTQATDVSNYVNDPTEIHYFSSLYSPTPGNFDMLNLNQPFFWNGVDNILVEICFDMVPNWTSTGTVRYYNSTAGYIYRRSDSNNLCGDVADNPIDEKPQIMLELSNQVNIDAGITRLIQPLNPFTAGLQPVQVEIMNFGTDSLTSAEIGWSVNGSVQTPVSWTGNLGSISKDTVTLGSFNFIANQTYDILAWTSLPNGQADSVVLNDTLSAPNLQSGLEGAYTIGGISPDFSSLSAAIQELRTRGVAGPVFFNIRDGVYDEKIYLTAYPGMSASNPVVFQSENMDSSLVTLTTVGTWDSNYVFYLDNARFITIRHLTIHNTGTDYGIGIYVVSDCNDLTISNHYQTDKFTFHALSFTNS